MSLDIRLRMKLDTGNELYEVILYEGNITHNLGEMAEACGLYDAMWRPYRLIGISDEEAYKDDTEKKLNIRAYEIIDKLEKGLEELKKYPESFKKLNPDNNWGSYEGLVRVASEYLDACKSYPNATVVVWR